MNDNKENRDPLESVHDIQRVICELEVIIRAMTILGMKDGADDLRYVQETVYNLAKEASAGICRETHGRLMDSQRSTGELLGAVLDSCIAQEESH